MSQLLINEYLKQLDLIKKVGGSSRETIVSEVVVVGWISDSASTKTVKQREAA